MTTRANNPKFEYAFESLKLSEEANVLSKRIVDILDPEVGEKPLDHLASSVAGIKDAINQQPQYDQAHWVFTMFLNSLAYKSKGYAKIETGLIAQIFKSASLTDVFQVKQCVDEVKIEGFVKTIKENDFCNLFGSMTPDERHQVFSQIADMAERLCPDANTFTASAASN